MMTLWHFVAGYLLIGMFFFAMATARMKPTQEGTMLGALLTCVLVMLTWPMIIYQANKG